MIPTGYKAKLPGYLSYPVKAGEISTALAESAHHDELTMVFYSRPVNSALEFQKMLADRSPYPVIEAEYRPAQKPGLSAAAFMIAAGWYNERWRLTIYPVLRELRHLANGLLHEQGFPALRLWLERARTASRGVDVQRVELVFDPAQAALLFRTGDRPRKR
jgi:hypothetical protein